MTEAQLLLDLGLILPELLLAGGAMALLVFGVLRGEDSAPAVAWGASALLIAAAVLVVALPPAASSGFAGALVFDDFSRFLKVLVLIGSALAIVMARDFLRAERIDRFETPVLIVFAALGMMLMVSANDMLALYMGLELQSLTLYVLAAINRDSTRSTEAGLKYFVLGALSSGLLLYGISLVYGFTGATNFDAIALAVGAQDTPPIGFIVGLVFMAAALAFKISAVPFHMWTPDVYEGAPTPITAFFAAAPKVAAMALVLRVFYEAFAGALDEWRQIIVFVALASMLLGSFAAIGQSNIKRLMAYSSIAHMGFALVGLAAASETGLKGVLLYLAIYLATNLGVFVCILSMRRKEGMVERIEDLAGLGRRQPWLAFALWMLLFSLAGIPPLAGFWAKYYVFLAAIEAELYTLAVIGVLASVVGAYYYLRIVKIMYFDDPAPEFEPGPRGAMGLILFASTVFTLFYVVLPGPLVAAATAAAASLAPGG